MCQPFIRNDQYNVIRNQAETALRALRTASDPKIVASVRLGAQTAIAELFPGLADERRTMLDAVTELKTAEEAAQYLQALEPYLLGFPPITEAQIRKLFPKNKKLKLPDLAQVDFRRISYLSWTDTATNKMFLVYAKDGRFVGVEGRYTATNKKGYCFACNRLEELALFSAVSKKRPANASPDYYRSVGNYVCLNGEACNKNMTDVAALEAFLGSVLG